MNNEINNESVKKKRSFVFIIWILPLIALLISSWMVFKHLNEKAEEITVYFDSADGFVVDKTPLNYKGIKIGVVSKITINEKNLNEFIITLQINKKVKSIIAKEGSIFWKVEPKVTLTEISGLNTILSGVYIETAPSSDKLNEIYKNKDKFSFKAVNDKPINLLKNKGVFITLHSAKSNLTEGSPVLYKSFVVGSILKKYLKNEEVFYTIFIKNKYKNLIKENTNFWKINAIDLKASLSGIELKVESLATLVAGGITFDSKKDDELLKNNNKSFKLYNSKEQILYDDKIITLTQASTKGLDESLTQVYYKGFVIGEIIDVKYLSKTNQSKFYIKLKKDYMNLLEYQPYFYIVKPKLSFDKIEEISSVLKSNYIEMKNYSKKRSDVKYDFILHKKEKKVSMFSVILKTKDNVKISKGSPVYFKDIKVGMVTYKKLLNKSDTMKVKLDIYWKYRYLINNSSLFYVESPIEINANLSGINIKTAPIKSYLKSAISFTTHDLKRKSTTHNFELLDSYKTMLEKQYIQVKGKKFKIQVDKLTSLNKNDFIYYKGVEAGKVLSSSYNHKNKKIDIELFIFEKFAKLINTSTRFYSIGGIDIDISLDKINFKTKSLDTLIKGAISFITLNEKAKKTKKNHRFKFYKNLDDAKEKYLQASILMPRAYNLKKGSNIVYKDMTIGKIKELEFTKDNMIIASFNILKSQENLLREDSIFYLNDFVFSLNKIQNTKAALLGPNISIIKGTSSIKKTKFNLLGYKPLEDFDKKGLRIIVKANMKSSLKQNSPVFYRQLQIGSVEKYTLASDSSHVKLQLLIDEKYQHLVRKNSIFYNAGTFGVDLYLFGVKIKTETLETLINGGISMVTPTVFEGKANSMKEYILHSDLKEEWLEWSPKIIE